MLRAVDELQVIGLSEDEGVALDPRDLAQQRGHEETALRVHARHLPVGVEALLELRLCAVNWRHRGELFLQRVPDRHRKDQNVDTGNGRQEEFRPERLLDRRAEHGRNLEAALLVHRRFRAASKAVHTVPLEKKLAGGVTGVPRLPGIPTRRHRQPLISTASIRLESG